MRGRILIVDDDREMCEVIAARLRRDDLSPTCLTSAPDAFTRLQAESFDVVLTDLKMPVISGIELCERIVENRPEVPVIVITGFGSLDSAVAALRAGAYDFVTKPIEMDLLSLIVERALRHRRLQQQVQRLSESARPPQRFEELIGESAAMQEVFQQLDRIARTEATVLLSGESGTGKELTAKALHRRSDRRDGPWLAVNCAALPANLLESELFGHTKGAFTDAREARHGLLVAAQGGTLFLDEIGELPRTLQPKLLRALEERCVRPVGGNTEVPFDVRLIVATNRDLERDVAAGHFRKDLFYRISVIPLYLPPLRARGTDVLLLANHFVAQLAARNRKPVRGISEAAARKLLSYDWPGNVRELRNALERAVALTELERLSVEDLPERIRDYHSARLVLTGSEPADLLPLAEVERRYIRHVLESVGGNRTLAARVLQVARRTLYRKLESYGLVGAEHAEDDAAKSDPHADGACQI